MAKSAGRKRSARKPVRTGTSVEALKQAFIDNLCYIQGKFPVVATSHDHYMALAYTVRDRLLERWIETGLAYFTGRARTVCYLSAEFLLGPQLGANLLNLGLTDRVREALHELGLDLDAILDEEEEPGLGNGGLGRLAACYLDSLATLEVPSFGYGIRYEFGIFDQEIRDGWQVEVTDKWLRLGNPWELPRPEIAMPVGFGGKTVSYRDPAGRYRVRWEPHRLVLGVAYDTPVLGYEVETANLLRLWKAEACESFDFEAFNLGDYYGAVGEKIRSENITKVLYPNDSLARGKELRLEQQYFFVSCSLQDMIRIHLQTAEGLDDFHEKYAVQLNDTHPALAVPELMRLLVDEHAMDWERAWDITRKSFGYTNHTLLPEALETWPIALFEDLLPRHLEIVYEINRRFLHEVRGRFPGDDGLVRRLSLIDESGGRSVRMAHVASVGSHAINGVAALHTELLKTDVLRDFYELWPEKFSNKTNGVTPRRFVALANPGLARLVSSRIGDGWIRDLAELRRLEPLVEDPELHAEIERVKLENKRALAELVAARTGVEVDPESLYDVHVKRIHEYKRQHLNVLHVITRYLELKREPSAGLVPRTFLFAGKAAPGYFMAKLIVKLIHGVAEVVNADLDVGGRLRVAFLPDFNVKLAERIYPAADLSEQISTAGKEASGTGNMKFALNGALTLGTLDGANVEMREEVGDENFFLFGLTAPEVRELVQRGYRPRDFYDSDVHLREAIDAIAAGRFSRGDRDVFRPLLDVLLGHDPFLVLADYRAYVHAQRDVDRAFADRSHWTRMVLLNVARMGKFSSDRAIREYCEDIWHAGPVPVGTRRRARKGK